MNLDSLDMVFERELQDIYAAESQMLKQMPKMAKMASSDALREALEEHRGETERQIERLETIAGQLDLKLNAKRCKGMDGLLDEEREVLESDGEEACIDIALAAAVQRAEHYEISAYSSARTIAQQLGYDQAAELLEQSLREEEAADHNLTQIAIQELFAAAAAAEEAYAEEEVEIEEEQEGSKLNTGTKAEPNSRQRRS